VSNDDLTNNWLGIQGSYLGESYFPWLSVPAATGFELGPAEGAVCNSSFSVAERDISLDFGVAGGVALKSSFSVAERHIDLDFGVTGGVACKRSFSVPERAIGFVNLGVTRSSFSVPARNIETLRSPLAKLPPGLFGVLGPCGLFGSAFEAAFASSLQAPIPPASLVSKGNFFELPFVGSEPCQPLLSMNAYISSANSFWKYFGLLVSEIFGTEICSNADSSWRTCDGVEQVVCPSRTIAKRCFGTNVLRSAGSRSEHAVHQKGFVSYRSKQGCLHIAGNENWMEDPMKRLYVNMIYLGLPNRNKRGKFGVRQ